MMANSKQVRFKGEVRNFAQRSEVRRQGTRDIPLTVWNFTLERYDNTGAQLSRIPIQMRGEAFRGSILDGHEVGIYEDWTTGLLTTNCVHNFTTSVDVMTTKAEVALGTKIGQWVFNLIFPIIFGAFILWGVVGLISTFFRFH
jgi:hypothetical protein